MTESSETPQSIALFGGSFNPPHTGHVMIGAWVLSYTDVDELWVVPTWNHAFSKALVDFEVRCQMCTAAFGALDNERLRVSEVERQMGGESRTIDTVEFIRSTWNIDDIRIVVGADIFTERHLWKRWDALSKMCSFIVIGRDGYSNPEGFEVSPPLLDVSSTEVRQSIAEGVLPPTLPQSVASIIQERNLYA
jgi:nicotinate-nucleotide adenylyltransferase